jgi:hypothetical protein
VGNNREEIKADGGVGREEERREDDRSGKII